MSDAVIISKSKDGAVSVLVDAGFADSLYDCLGRNGLKVRPPIAAIFSRKKIYVDKDGRIQIEEEAVESEISIDAPPADLEKVIGNCLRKLQ